MQFLTLNLKEKQHSKAVFISSVQKQLTGSEAYGKCTIQYSPDLICDVNLVFVAFFSKFARGEDAESQENRFNITMVKEMAEYFTFI